MLQIDSTDRVRLAIHDLGGDGPPILFAHATGLHGHCWEPVARRLPTYRSWALDFRGHGDSSKPEGLAYDWAGFADDVLAAVDGLELDRPLGVGHSKGGAALLLAEAQRPGTFRALWCFDPVVFPPSLPRPVDGEGESPLAAGAARRKATFVSHDEALANYRTKPPFDIVSDEALRAYVDHGFDEQPDGRISLKCPPEVEAQVYRMGASQDIFGLLDRVTCAVTIARAGVTGAGPAAFAEHVAAALPHGHLADFPHLDHFGPLQAPDEVATSIASAFSPA